MALFFNSCAESLQSDKRLQDDESPGIGVTLRQSDRDIELELNSSDPRHEEFARELSKLFVNEQVRTLYKDYVSAWGDKTVLLADFFYTNILIDRGQTEAPLQAEMSFFTCEFLEEYFSTYPGVEGAFVDFNDTIPPDLEDADFAYEVFLMYDDIDDAPGFIEGDFTEIYGIEDVPTGNVFKIGTGESHFVSRSVDAEGNGFRRQFWDLFSCNELVTFVNSQGFGEENITSASSCSTVHPLSGLNVVSLDNLLNFFNNNCSDPLGIGVPTVDGPGSGDDDGSEPGDGADPRSTCDRDVLRNERETLVDVRSIGGAGILRDCDKWCPRRKRNCIFQVDVVIPTSTSEDDDFEVIGTIKKVFTTGERRLRKNWRSDRLRDSPLPITEWLFLEEKHGDEWQYSWTGRHHRRGTEIEQNLGINLSNKVGFKKAGLDVGKERKNNASIKVTRANEDCFLGDEISRYCRPLREKLYSGDLYFLVNEQAL